VVPVSNTHVYGINTKVKNEQHVRLYANILFPAKNAATCTCQNCWTDQFCT